MTPQKRARTKILIIRPTQRNPTLLKTPPPYKTTRTKIAPPNRTKIVPPKPTIGARDPAVAIALVVAVDTALANKKTAVLLPVDDTGATIAKTKETAVVAVRGVIILTIATVVVAVVEIANANENEIEKTKIETKTINLEETATVDSTIARGVDLLVETTINIEIAIECRRTPTTTTTTTTGIIPTTTIGDETVLPFIPVSFLPIETLEVVVAVDRSPISIVPVEMRGLDHPRTEDHQEEDRGEEIGNEEEVHRKIDGNRRIM